MVGHFPIKASEGGFNPRSYRHGAQLTLPHACVVTQRLGDGMPGFVCVPVRLRDRESNLVGADGLVQAPREVSSVAHHPTAVTSNEASMTSRRPQQSSDTSVPLLVEPPGGIEPATPSLPFVLPRTCNKAPTGQRTVSVRG